MTRTSVLATTIVSVILGGLAFLVASPVNGHPPDSPFNPFAVLDEHPVVTAGSNTVLSFRDHCFFVGGLSNELANQSSPASCGTGHPLGNPVTHQIQEPSFTADFFPAIDQIAAEMKRIARQYDALGLNRTIQVEDPYWKYYDDCDRWNVVFAGMEYWATDSDEPTNCVGAPQKYSDDAGSANPIANFDDVDRMLLQAKMDYELLSGMRLDSGSDEVPEKSNLFNASFRRPVEHTSPDFSSGCPDACQANQFAAVQIASGISNVLQFAAETMTDICHATIDWVKSAEFVLIESNFDSCCKPAKAAVRLEKVSPWNAISYAAANGMVRGLIWTKPLVWGDETQILLNRRFGNSLLMEPLLDWSFNVRVQYRQMQKMETERISRWVKDIARRASWLNLHFQSWSISMARAVEEQTQSVAR